MVSKGGLSIEGSDQELMTVTENDDDNDNDDNDNDDNNNDDVIMMMRMMMIKEGLRRAEVRTPAFTQSSFLGEL